MSIAKRIRTALDHMADEDYENALIQISIAVDATGKRRFSKDRPGVRCRSFVESNMDLIHYFATDGRIQYDGEVEYEGKGNLANALYKSVRCALIHEGDVSQIVEFEKGLVMGQKNNKLIISDQMLLGILLAVVLAPENIKEKMGCNYSFVHRGNEVSIDSLWGGLSSFTIA